TEQRAQGALAAREELSRDDDGVGPVARTDELRFAVGDRYNRRRAVPSGEQCDHGRLDTHEIAREEYDRFGCEGIGAGDECSERAGAARYLLHRMESGVTGPDLDDG